MQSLTSACLLLVGAATALQLPYTVLRSPVLVALPQAVRHAHVVASSDDADTAMIGGKVVEVGDRVLCRDDESDAWWSAWIRQIRGSELLITFVGCDNAWDTWMDASSPDLTLMDAVDKKKEEQSFQADTFEETLTDDEMIEEYRKQRWDDNARWQLTTFAEAQMGGFGGTAELYEAVGDRVKKMTGPWLPTSTSEAKIVGAQEVQLTETLPAPVANLALDLHIGVERFRPELGNMAVGGAYTLAVPSKGADGKEDGGWLLEMCLREESRRVRCKLLYRPSEDLESNAAMRISSVAIVRETEGGVEFVSSDSEVDVSDLDGSPGRGLYDPPPGSKLGYISVYSEGGITLVFPNEVAAGNSGVISLDWIAGRMRYQIDRKFEQLDGSLASLELTEISKADSETYLPDFPHQGGGGQGGGGYGGHMTNVNWKPPGQA